MAGKPVVPSKDEFKMVPEDDPRVQAERYLNRTVALVERLTRELRQAKSDERRARAEVARL